MYCPKCGGLVENKKCQDCHYEVSDELWTLNPNRGMSKQDNLACIMAYILCPASMFMKTEDTKTVKYHQAQGFTLFILQVLTVAAFLIPTIGRFVGIALVALDAFLMFKGVSNVRQGEKTKLPLIGDFTFLKI